MISLPSGTKMERQVRSNANAAGALHLFLLKTVDWPLAGTYGIGGCKANRIHQILSRVSLINRSTGLTLCGQGSGATEISVT